MIYLVNTRPDIAFPVSMLGRYTHDPCMRHWEGVKHLLGYIRGTPDTGLHYKARSSQGEIMGMSIVSDAGYKSCSVTGKSQLGYFILLNGTPIATRSNKSSLNTDLSSSEAEVTALSEAMREGHAFIMLMSELNINVGQWKYDDNQNKIQIPIPCFCDNLEMVETLNAGKWSHRVQHIMPKITYVYELIKKHKIYTLSHIDGEKNPADMTTKTIDPKRQRDLNKLVNIRSISDAISLQETIDETRRLGI